MLQSTGDRLRFSELREQFPEYATEDYEAGRRKFERDKQDLAGLGVHIEPLGFDGDYAYRLDVKGSFLTQPIELDSGERTLLAVLAAEAMESKSFPYKSLLQVALSKLRISPEVAGSLLIRHPPKDPESVTCELVEKLAEAIVAQKRVSFRHMSWAGHSMKREIEPYGLFLKLGHWYLCGRCVSFDDVRVFRLSKMADAEVNPNKPSTPDFEVPEGFSLSEHARLDPLGYRFHEAMTVEVAVSPSVRHIAAMLWGDAKGDDQLRFSIETTNLSALIEQVLGLGRNAEIVSPDEARTEIRAVLSAILEAHEEAA